MFTVRYAATNVLTLLVASLAFHPSVCLALLSRDDAKQIAIDDAISGSATESSLFAYLLRSSDPDSVLHSGESIRSFGAESPISFTAATETYFVFIDDFPGAQYQHPVRYVFIDANTGASTVQVALSFPLVNGTDRKYETAQARIGSPDKFFGADSNFVVANRIWPSTDDFTSATPPNFRTLDATDTCAVIVRNTEGDAGPDSATADAVRKAKSMFQSLGVGAVKEIAPATGPALGESLKTAGSGKDVLYVYYVGHGWSASNTSDGGPMLPGPSTNQDDLYPTWTAVACSLEASGAKKVVAILDCCYSGRAVVPFQSKSFGGTILVAAHSDSTAAWWGKQLPGGTIMAETHYTAALSGCLGNAAADTSNPSNGVDLGEAHRWARMDSLAKKGNPPLAGTLGSLRLTHTQTYTIPESLTAKGTGLFPGGMASSPLTGLAYPLFQPAPASAESIRVFLFEPTGTPPFRPKCVTPKPIVPGFMSDLAPGIPELGRFYVAVPTTGEMFDTDQCGVRNIYPSSTFAVMRDPNSNILFTGGDFQSGSETITLVSSAEIVDPFQPPVSTGFEAPIVHYDNANGNHVFLLDFAKMPPETYEATSGVGDLYFALGQRTAGGTVVEFLELRDDLDDGPVFTNVGTAALDLQPNAAGIAVLPTPLDASEVFVASQVQSPVTIYVINGTPGPDGFEVLAYEVDGLLPPGTVDVPPDPSEGGGIALLPGRPNPSNGFTIIDFSLPGNAQRVTLRLYDVRGRLVRELADESMAAGSYSLPWDGRTVGGSSAAPGIYFYRLRVHSGGRIEERTQRLVVLR